MAVSNGVGLVPVFDSGGGGSSSASSIGSGGSAGFGATGGGVTFGGVETALAGLASGGWGFGRATASFFGSGGSAGFGATGGGVTVGGVETTLAGLASSGWGFGGATGRGATDSPVGTGVAVAGLTSATRSGGCGLRFHGFQTARAPPRPSTATTAASTAGRERLAGPAGSGTGITGRVGWATTTGAGPTGAVGAPEKVCASAPTNSQQLVKRSAGVLARAFARTASTPRGRAAFRVHGGGGASLTIL